MASGGNRGDFDDWFDEPEAPPAQPRRRGGRREPEPLDEGWVVPEERVDPRPRRRSEPIVVAGRELTQGQLAILGACAIALLLAILAAAGVFSGGKQAAAPTLATVTQPPPSVTPSGSDTSTTPTKPAVQAPSTTLKPGDTGGEVTTLQKALAALGYSPGKADGNYGPGTKQAVADFQTAKGLDADGVVGPKTLTALQQALARG
ncbi:MAG TPA: peptidoglycan-binding domain-containing protein [Gaiellaceae bacterium]|nr:peptidoglycan-binding domain-containing protein [Gaiellaceae bacterium]